MTLEERYIKAADSSYVGKVRAQQAAIDSSGKDISGVKRGVDFLDGEPKGLNSTAPDQIQTEFTRNDAGDFRYGGGGKVPGGPDNKYALSRWLNKGVVKGDTYIDNNRFTVLNDVRNSGTLLQRYNWLKDADTFTGKLPNLSKGKVVGSPSGPSPNGLNG